MDDVTPSPPADVTSPEWWSTLSSSVGQFFVSAGQLLLQIAIIIVVCVLIGWVLRIFIRRLVHTIVSGAKKTAKVDDTQALDRSPLSAVRLVQRTRTLGSILSNIVNITLVIVALVLIISAIAPDALGSLALLTAALGAGLGFGAQNIVKDVLNGVFLVAEDQIGIGDVVDLGLATGIVEYVSVRVTHVRDVNGTLWYVRNGEVTRIGNMSQGWSRVIIDLGVPTDADIDDVEGAILNTAIAMSKDGKWRSRILERPEIWGLEAISGEHMIIRLVMRTRANAKEDVAAELRARLKATLDAMDVQLPKLHSTILSGSDGAQRVRGARPPRTLPVPTTPPAPPPAPERVFWRPKRTGSTEPKRTNEPKGPSASKGSTEPKGPSGPKGQTGSQGPSGPNGGEGTP